MVVQFKCPTCQGFVEYEQVSVKVSPYQQYGIPQYKRISRCQTCFPDSRELECQSPPPRTAEL
jgi:hypothetical protein